MRTWFDDDKRPVAVDETHPVDLLEPEPDQPARSTPDALMMIEQIGGSFIRGNPFIVQTAWAFLLNRQSRSMRACAARLGCTPQAISRQVTRLAKTFRYPISNRLRRQMQQAAAHRSWKARKQREDRNPPAAGDDPSTTNTPATPDKRPSVHGGGVNDSSVFTLPSPT